MNSYKDETLKQLNIRRTIIASSLHYAQIKLKAFNSDQTAALSSNQATQKNEFVNQVAFCQAELIKIDGCINWIKLIAS